MNGYQMHIDAYKKFLEEPDANKEYIQAEIRALEPFAERTEPERIKMFDTGAFNEVAKAYCRAAMTNCDIDSETIKNVLKEMEWLFDTVEANKIIKR